MEFSVLMSVYIKENPQYLRESIDSVYAQTLMPGEVILVEDGKLTPELYSTIDELSAKYDTLRVIPLKEKLGMGGALNEGLKAAKNEVVARMDTDDICKPQRFERQIEFMESHPEVDLCSSWIDEFEGTTDNIISQRKLPEKHRDIVEFAKRKCPANHPATVYRKSKVLQAGGYKNHPEDYILWVKMLMNGCIFHNIQESLLWFRFSKNVIRRRGGLKYAWHETGDQWQFYRMGFISLPRLAANVATRLTVRLMPNSMRNIVYRKLLRD